MDDPVQGDQLKSIVEPRITGLARIGRERFEYDANTGDLRFRDPGPSAFKTQKGYRIFKRAFVGKIAGSASSGYVKIILLGRSFMAHRIIWAMVHGVDPGATIDHRDGDPLNNRLSNLRQATRSQNAMNRRARSDNSSGCTGVHWHASSRKWAAAIGAGKARQHLGLFDNIADASSAYRQAAARRHGEFAAHLGVRAGAA